MIDKNELYGNSFQIIALRQMLATISNNLTKNIDSMDTDEIETYIHGAVEISNLLTAINQQEILCMDEYECLLDCSNCEFRDECDEYNFDEF